MDEKLKDAIRAHVCEDFLKGLCPGDQTLTDQDCMNCASEFLAGYNYAKAEEPLKEGE